MAVDVDALIDRRRIKRRLTIWRIVAIALGVGLVAALIAQGAGSSRPHIARVSVDGFIAGSPEQDDFLRQVAADESIRAVVLSINSPGGTAVGSEALYRRLREISGNKPIVAVVRSVGASGGYMAALATDRIIALENSVIGSIGVRFEVPEFSELLSTIGVRVNHIRSTPLKGGASLTEPMSDEIRAEIEVMVEDAFEYFKNMVQERRGLTDEELAVVSDGRVFSGRMAIKNGLIDEIGGEDEARAWLEETHGIEGDLPFVDAEPAEDLPFMNQVMVWVTGDTRLTDRLSLDGLLTLWHPY